MQLEVLLCACVCSKEVRSLSLSPTDPTLVGLPPGAAAVRHMQQTLHALALLKRMHLLQSADSEGDAVQPEQVGPVSPFSYLTGSFLLNIKNI